MWERQLIFCHMAYIGKKHAPSVLGLGLDLNASSSLDLDSELTDSLDLDLDGEQRVELAVWTKLTQDVMVDLLGPILSIGVMLWKSLKYKQKRLIYGGGGDLVKLSRLYI